MDELPPDVDLIILGTGLPESIVAAAASRLDRSVLQLDENDYYGRDWAGFRLQDLRLLLQNSCEDRGFSQSDYDDADYNRFAKEGEKIFALKKPHCSISFFEEVAYARFDIVEPDIAPQARHERYRKLSQRSNSGSSMGSGRGEINDTSPTSPSTPPPSPKRHTTFEDLMEMSRRFSLDLTPKLFWTTDRLVKLLISSNISRYASFVLVQSIAATVNNKIVEVPYSRAGIYNYPEIDASHKRRLMKFMQICMDPDRHEKELSEMDHVTIGTHLASMKIPAVTREALITAIALGSLEVNARVACHRIHRFLSSCGRYGAESSPFLFPIYGCGEYPQYFARISAVFGGTQCLNRGIEAVITDESGEKINAVISRNQRVDCKQIVLPIDYAPLEWKIPSLPIERVSRAILITSGSLFSRPNSQASFLRIPKEQDDLGLILVEVSSSAEVCPRDYHVVYMWMRSVGSARKDLEHHVLQLFEPARADYSRMEKPKVLWVCYYNHEHVPIGDLNKRTTSCDLVPKNVQFVNGPDGTLDYDDVVDQGMDIFNRIYPNLPFLPRVPDPEDVILDGDNDGAVQNDSLDVVDKA